MTLEITWSCLHILQVTVLRPRAAEGYKDSLLKWGVTRVPSSLPRVIGLSQSWGTEASMAQLSLKSDNFCSQKETPQVSRYFCFVLSFNEILGIQRPASQKIWIQSWPFHSQAELGVCSLRAEIRRQKRSLWGLWNSSRKWLGPWTPTCCSSRVMGPMIIWKHQLLADQYRPPGCLLQWVLEALTWRGKLISS